jgi:hypothetical protein
MAACRPTRESEATGQGPGASRTGWDACLPPGPVSAADTGPLGKPPIVEKASEPHFIDFISLPGNVDIFKILIFSCAVLLPR